MNSEIRKLLESVQAGKTSVDDAMLELKKAPFEDIGYAKVDLHRKVRQGAAEVIYGAGKTPEQIGGIIDAMRANGQNRVLITRMSPEAAAHVGSTRELDYHKDARGADRTAQEACLAAGGRVISIVADELSKQARRRNLLYLSEDDFDGAFSTQRALSRNRCIHALGRMVFVAQSDFGHGGTWDGTVKNLRFGWSPVACFRDGSQAARQLEQMGAYLIGTDDLQDFGGLMEEEKTLF